MAAAAAAKSRLPLVTDPQTSGGLSVACGVECAEEVLAAFSADGFDQAAVIGRMQAGAPRLAVI